VKKKLMAEHHEDFHKQGVVGTDHHFLDELKGMMKNLDEDAHEEALQEGLQQTTMDADCCKVEGITVLALAESRTRRRLHRRLVAAILDAVPNDLKDRKDARNMRALDYARVFGDEDIIQMLRSTAPVRPRSPSAMDDMSIFHYPRSKPYSFQKAPVPQQGGTRPPSPTGSGGRITRTNSGQVRPTSALSVNSFASTAQMSDQPREGEAREGWGETSTAPSTRPQTPVLYSVRKGGHEDSEKESKVP
jgi:hypothetical protein